MLLDSMREGAMPFYAAITAIICVQQNRKASVDVAANREIATLIGGAAGLIFLVAESWFGRAEPAAFRYLLLSLALVPLISVSVWMNRTKSTFLMCVVFLSVAVLHAADVSPYIFALNRVIDTSLGIIIALIVNIFPDLIKGRLHSDPPGDV